MQEGFWFSQVGACYSLFLLAPMRCLICLSLSLSFIELLSLCILPLAFPWSQQQTGCVSSLWCVISTPCPSCPRFHQCPCQQLLEHSGSLQHLIPPPSPARLWQLLWLLRGSECQKSVEFLQLPHDMVREIGADLNSCSSRQHQCLRHKFTLPFTAMGSISDQRCLNGLWSRHRKQSGLWVKAKQRVTTVRAESLPALCS